MTDTISHDDDAQWPALDTPVYGGVLRRLTGVSRTTAMTAAVSLVLVGGVTTAVARNFAPGADAADAIPASAFGIVQIDLSLPDGQDEAVAHLVKRLPGALDSSGSIRDRLLRAFLKDSEDPHVDYDTSVKSWLGDHVAVAGWTDGSGAPKVEFLLQSTDDSAARKEIRKAAPDVGLAFSHGFAVLAETQSDVDDAVRAASKSSLSDRSTYTDDVAALDGSPAVTGWLDATAAVKAIENALTRQVGAGGPDISLFGGFGNASGRIVAGLRVSDDGDNSAVQLDVIQRGNKPSTRATSTDRLRHLPATTLAATAIADPAGIVRDIAGAITGPLALFLGGMGGESCSVSSLNPEPQCEPTAPSDPMAEISQAIGLSIPDDLVSLLGTDAVLAYGGIAGGGMPKIGLRSKPADVQAAADVVTKLRDKLANVGVELAERPVDGGDFVLATTDDYADDLAKAGSLGTADRFADAMRGMPSSVQVASYIDLGALLPLATHGLVPQLDHLTAAGLWSGNVDGLSTTRIRLIIH